MIQIHRNDLKEKLITFGFLTGIFLPVRLLFYSFVSEYWFSSVAMISIFAVGLLVIIHKEKLGRLGKILSRQLTNAAKSRFGKIAIIQSIIMMYFLGAITTSDGFSNLEIENQINDVFKKNGISDYNDFDDIYKEIEFESKTFIFSLLLLFVSPIILPEFFGSFISVIDEMFHGWFLHFMTVFFIEEVEIFLLMFVYRHKGRIFNNSKISN